MSKQNPVYYADYLGLDKVLNAQHPESAKRGPAAHDETLFIIIHQTYELWFKQILHELKAVQTVFAHNPLPEVAISGIVAKLRRIIEIQKILIDQLRVMETMTPLDFLDFRDDLIPASGFQSIQFRLIETNLGLKANRRMQVEKDFFQSRLKPHHQKILDEAQKETSLLENVQAWLERMPFAQMDDWDFWRLYSQEIEKMMKEEESIIASNPTLNEELKKLETKNLELTRESFQTLLDAKKYQKLLDEGKVHLSQKAMLNALFIELYRDWPLMNLPHQLLTCLIDIDEMFTTWRYRHAIMAHRLLGTKIGTGGSSGHEYLKKTTERNRIFLDLFNLATFLLPKSKIPALPQELKSSMSFLHE